MVVTSFTSIIGEACLGQWEYPLFLLRLLAEYVVLFGRKMAMVQYPVYYDVDEGLGHKPIDCDARCRDPCLACPRVPWASKLKPTPRDANFHRQFMLNRISRRLGEQSRENPCSSYRSTPPPPVTTMTCLAKSKMHDNNRPKYGVVPLARTLLIPDWSTSPSSHRLTSIKPIRYMALKGLDDRSCLA